MKSLQVSNFRPIKDSLEVSLSPITVLIGANSTGKSSISKALVLGSWIHKLGRVGELNADDKVDEKLGIYGVGEAIHNYNAGRKQTSSYSLAWKDQDFEVRVVISDREPNGFVESYELFCHLSDTVVFGIEYSAIEAGEPKWKCRLALEYFELARALFTQRSNKQVFDRIDFQKRQFTLKGKGVKDTVLGQLPSHLNDILRGKVEYKKTELPQSLTQKWKDFDEILFHLIDEVSRADKESNSELFNFRDYWKTAQEIKRHGTFHLELFDAKSRLLKKRSYTPSDRLWNDLKKRAGKPYNQAWTTASQDLIKNTLDSLGIKRAKLKVEMAKNGELLILLGRNPIYTLGQGHYQALQLLIEICCVLDRIPSDKSIEKTEARHIFCIEEPESNLHPNAQSQMGIFIAHLLNDLPGDFAIILETHSEYIVRQLQLLVKDGLLSDESVGIQYLWKSNEEVKVREIKINKSGQLSDEFGQGFFDEAHRLIASTHLD